MTELRASVRQVVEFSLHERDLSPAAFAAKRMREGAAAHKARQSAGAREEAAYPAEKSLSADYAAREITLRVTGRADGLLLAADGARIVEEIKLGTAENPLVPAHRAQAAMYGHMLCQKEGLTGVRLRILYVDENGAPVRLYEEEADGARLATDPAARDEELRQALAAFDKCLEAGGESFAYRGAALRSKGKTQLALAGSLIAQSDRA